MKTLVSALLVIGLVTATTTPLPAQDRERLGTVRFRTSCAVAPPRLMMKLACFAEISAPPTRLPRRPAFSRSFATWS